MDVPLLWPPERNPVGRIARDLPAPFDHVDPVVRADPLERHRPWRSPDVDRDVGLVCPIVGDPLGVVGTNIAERLDARRGEAVARALEFEH